MSDVTDPLAWVQRAEEDYITARYSLRHKTPPTYIICFHAQQCAEKYMKALLISRAAVFPKTHDLQILSDLCTHNGILVGTDPKRLHELSEYGVKVRYPGDDPILAEARQAFEIAKSICLFARKLFGIR